MNLTDWRLFQSVSRLRRRKQISPQIQELEDRSLLASYAWVGGLEGAWNQPSNWKNEADGSQGVPGKDDAAYIRKVNLGPSGQLPSDAKLHFLAPKDIQVKSIASYLTIPVAMENTTFTASDSAGFYGGGIFSNVQLKTRTFDASDQFMQNGGSLIAYSAGFHQADLTNVNCQVDWWLSASDDFIATGSQINAEKLDFSAAFKANKCQITTETWWVSKPVEFNGSQITMTDLIIETGGSFTASAQKTDTSNIVVGNVVTIKPEGRIDLGTKSRSTFHIGNRLDVELGTVTVGGGLLSVGPGVKQNDERIESLVIRPGGAVNLSGGVVIDSAAVNIESESNSQTPSDGRQNGSLYVVGHARFTGDLINNGSVSLRKTYGISRWKSVDVKSEAVLDVTGSFQQGFFGSFEASGDDADHLLAPWLYVRADPGFAGLPSFVQATASLAGFADLPDIPQRMLGPVGTTLIPPPHNLNFGPLITVEGISEGRFDIVDGDLPTSLRADRFLGVQYPWSKPYPVVGSNSNIEILYLETPRLLVQDGSTWSDHKPGQVDVKNRLTASVGPFPFLFPGSIPHKQNLVLIAPGTAATVEDWPLDMARAIAANSNIDADVAVFEWKEYNTGNIADPVHGAADWQPFIGSLLGIDIGDALAQWMWQTLSTTGTTNGFLNSYEHIHLLSHSGGSWLVDSLTDSLRKLPDVQQRLGGAIGVKDPFIHLTLFDAFNPTGPSDWLNRGGTYLNFTHSILSFVVPGLYTTPTLGDTADYADHFYDRRRAHWRYKGQDIPGDWAAVDMTDYPLDHFFNVDVTKLDPKLPPYIPVVDLEVASSTTGSPVLQRGHAWPRIYYLETIGNGVGNLLWDQNLAFHYSLEARGGTAIPIHDALHPRGNSPGFEPSDPKALASLAVSLNSTQTTTTGNVAFTPAQDVSAILKPSAGNPAGFTSQITLNADTDALQLSVLFAPQQPVTLRVTFDGLDLGTIDRSPLLRHGDFSALADVGFQFAAKMPAGTHTLTLTAESSSNDPVNPPFVAVGPISFHRPAISVPVGPAPVKLLDTRDKTTTKKGKTTSTVTFTFDAKVTVAKDAAQAVDVNGKVLKSTTKATFKNGQGIVTAKVSGPGPITLRLDGAKIKGATGQLADMDGDGVEGGVKELTLGTTGTS